MSHSTSQLLKIATLHGWLNCKCLQFWIYERKFIFHSDDLRLSIEKMTQSDTSGLTQHGQASVAHQPDSSLFNSLGAGVVKLTV